MFTRSVSDRWPYRSHTHSQAFDAYQKLSDKLDPATAGKVKAGNFERIFDATWVKVRAWEAAQIHR